MKKNKLMSWIDSRPGNVAFQTRFLCYCVDWFIGGIFTGLPAVLLYGAITKKQDMFSSLYIFEALGFERYWAFIVGFACLVFAMFYFVYVPWKVYPGQTLAKRWFKIKIVMVDGNDVTLKALVIRQVLGLFLLEGTAVVMATYIRQMITLLLSFYVDNIFQIITTLVCVFSTMLVGGTPSGRALHDYLAKTKVILVKE